MWSSFYKSNDWVTNLKCLFLFFLFAFPISTFPQRKFSMEGRKILYYYTREWLITLRLIRSYFIILVTYLQDVDYFYYVLLLQICMFKGVGLTYEFVRFII
jgi:hypothetical protein